MKHCRLCELEFSGNPLLFYQNMPKAVQFLPEIASLQDETGVVLEVWQCMGCGLIQLKSEPVPYYREVIRAVAFSEEMKAFRLNQFSRFVQDYSLGKKKVLEIGCGRGEFVSLMREAGTDAYGLEFSSASVSQGINNGLKVAQGFVDSKNYIISNGPFDGFFMLNFLEHLPHPNSTLLGIGHNLFEGGVGLIEVPNFDMMLRKKVFSEFTCDHLLYFTKETLKSVLSLNGFDVIECKEIWYDYIISAIVRKRKRLDLTPFNESQTKLTSEILRYIGRFERNSVAIWGAGHQAFSVIAMMKLNEKIRYVIDSAPFKQGKCTPATGIPIFGPEKLLEDPVCAIIIIAGGYSDEVARIIRQKFSRKMSVAILRDFGLEIVKHTHFISGKHS